MSNRSETNSQRTIILKPSLNDIHELKKILDDKEAAMESMDYLDDEDSTEDEGTFNEPSKLHNAKFLSMISFRSVSSADDDDDEIKVFTEML